MFNAVAGLDAIYAQCQGQADADTALHPSTARGGGKVRGQRSVQVQAAQHGVSAATCSVVGRSGWSLNWRQACLRLRNRLHTLPCLQVLLRKVTEAQV